MDSLCLPSDVSSLKKEAGLTLSLPFTSLLSMTCQPNATVEQKTNPPILSRPLVSPFLKALPPNKEK